MYFMSTSCPVRLKQSKSYTPVSVLQIYICSYTYMSMYIYTAQAEFNSMLEMLQRWNVHSVRAIPAQSHRIRVLVRMPALC